MTSDAGGQPQTTAIAIANPCDLTPLQFERRRERMFHEWMRLLMAAARPPTAPAGDEPVGIGLQMTLWD